jgi:cold shock CspA family protein
MAILSVKSKIEMLRRMLTHPDGLLLKLYANNRNDGHKNTLVHFTEVRDGDTGYEPIALDPEKWLLEPKGGFIFASYPEQFFVFQKPFGNVYGFYITNNGGDVLIWSERFKDAPFEIQHEGDRVKVKPVMFLFGSEESE